METRSSQIMQFCLSALASVSLLQVTSQQAQADVVESSWTSSEDFQYWIYHMPDFDQKRDLLPGDGASHCVPTSAINLMGYIGNHGFPEINPGAGNWQLQANYAWITDHIFAMGQLMGTDPVSGTGGAGHINGVNNWLPDDKFTATRMFVNGAWAPKIQDWGGSAITGALVNFCYGRYDVIGTQNGIPIIDRDGGHCVTLSRIDVNPLEDWLLWIRNPSQDDGNLFAQTLFANQAQSPQPKFCYAGANLRLYTELDVPNSAQLRLVDSYLAIRTKQGYSFDDIGNTVQVASPFGDLAGSLPNIDLDLPGGQAVREIFPLPDGFGYAALVEDTVADVELVQLFESPVDPLQRPTDSVEVDGACSMVLGDNRMLYVLCGDVLEMIDPDDRLRKLKRIVLPWACDKVLYDDRADQVYLFPQGGDPLLVLIFPMDLESGPVLQSLPPGSLPAGPCVGACAPDGTVYLADKATGDIHCLPPTFDSVQLIQVPGIDCVESIDVDDRGHLFIVCHGVLTEVVPDGKGGWEPDPRSAWDAMPVGKFFHIARSRTNYDDRTMRELDDNVEPTDPEEEAAWEEVADCLADTNADLLIDVADLLGLLAAWGTSDPLFDIAPLGGDGAVDVTDLLKVLADWGICP